MLFFTSHKGLYFPGPSGFTCIIMGFSLRQVNIKKRLLVIEFHAIFHILLAYIKHKSQKVRFQERVVIISYLLIFHLLVHGFIILSQPKVCILMPSRYFHISALFAERQLMRKLFTYKMMLFFKKDVIFMSNCAGSERPRIFYMYFPKIYIQTAICFSRLIFVFFTPTSPWASIRSHKSLSVFNVPTSPWAYVTQLLSCKQPLGYITKDQII